MAVSQFWLPWIIQHWESGDYFAPAKSQLTQVCLWKQLEVEFQQNC